MVSSDLDCVFRISGYASVFNAKDHQGDVILPGAFEQSVKEHNNNVRKIRLLWQHESAQPIGTIDKIHEDSHGLYFDASINCMVAKGKEAAALLNQGAVDSTSIGFTTLESSFNKLGTRLISQVSLWEISVVTFAANDQAKIDRSFAKLRKSILDLERSVKMLIKSS